MAESFRTIPSIEQLRQRDAMRALEEVYGRAALVDALRAEADDIRQGVVAAADQGDVIERIERGAAARLAREGDPSLRPVINATGVVIHTNLGERRLPHRRRCGWRHSRTVTATSSTTSDRGRAVTGTCMPSVC